MSLYVVSIGRVMSMALQKPSLLKVSGSDINHGHDVVAMKADGRWEEGGRVGKCCVRIRYVTLQPLPCTLVIRWSHAQHMFGERTPYTYLYHIWMTC